MIFYIFMLIISILFNRNSALLYCPCFLSQLVAALLKYCKLISRLSSYQEFKMEHDIT